jgi:thiol-disulfide isomerase/thioredoxin
VRKYLLGAVLVFAVALGGLAWFVVGAEFAAGVMVGVVASAVMVAAMMGYVRRAGEKRISQHLAPPPPPAEPWDYALAARTLAGERHDFAAARGRVLVLNFWATWCPPCVAELPSLLRLRQRMAGDPVDLACVTSESADVVRAFVGKRDMGELPVVLIDGEPPPAFATLSIPATFVVGKDGAVAYRHVGSARWDADEFVAFLRRLARGASA